MARRPKNGADAIITDMLSVAFQTEPRANKAPSGDRKAELAKEIAAKVKELVDLCLDSDEMDQEPIGEATFEDGTDDLAQFLFAKISDSIQGYDPRAEQRAIHLSERYAEVLRKFMGHAAEGFRGGTADFRGFHLDFEGGRSVKGNAVGARFSQTRAAEYDEEL